MPTVFRSPTSRPRSLGDGYRLYKKSIVPIVPVVDSIILDEVVVEEGEAPEKIIEKENGEIEQQGTKRKNSPEEESGSSSKKQKDESTKKGEGNGAEDDTKNSTGGETTAVSGKSNGDESENGDKGVSVPVESERDHPKQETENKSSSGEV